LFKLKGFGFVLVFFLSLGLLNLSVAEAVDVTGNWQGNWMSDYSGSGGLTVNMTQSGTTLGGSLTITNTECGTFSNLVLSGSISGDIISVYASDVCPLDGSFNSLNFTNGTVNGNHIAGSYSVYSDGEFWDSGEFELTRAVNIITASAGTGGSIVPSGAVSVNAGADQTFQINPSAGYSVLDVEVDGASVGAKTSHTFYNLSSNHTIAATFIRTHTITASAGPGGSISPSGSVSVEDGATQTFWFTPDPGYMVVSILYDGELIEARRWIGAEVKNVDADHTLKVIFERIGVIPGIPSLLMDE